MNAPPKRRSFTKAERLAVYEKTNGHCAYCGAEIEMRQMQVDHVISIEFPDSSNDLINLLPACRSCNNYKSTFSIEKFREMIERWPSVLMRDSVTFRNAVRFGMVEPDFEKRITFYFEDIGIEIAPNPIDDMYREHLERKRREAESCRD